MADQHARALAADGIEIVRIWYTDLHGVMRGKDVPVGEIDHKMESGIALTEAIMMTDLGHNVVLGFESGFHDVEAVPDVSTCVPLPWDPTVSLCRGQYREVGGAPFRLDPRAALVRAIDGWRTLGLEPVVAPELEYYVLDPETFAPHTPLRSRVYTVGDRSDPRGLLRETLDACLQLGLRPLGAGQEYGCGQYEINLAHGPALESADRNFLFKAIVKELASRHGLIATFMGRPNDDEGSGLHLHVSATGVDGGNAFADPSAPGGLSASARHFAAGVLAHADALCAFLMPTVNAYRRTVVESLAPTHSNWGHDNRLAMLRVPLQRGRATRVEVRAGDGSANIYLAIAATLHAGLDGLRRELEPPAPVMGNPYEDEDTLGPALPASLEASLDALAADDVLRVAMGEDLCACFDAIKRHELARWQAELERVTDWERREYAEHL